jgi:predicted  nucleic acid-binding Zn-ribbon protein
MVEAKDLQPTLNELVRRSNEIANRIRALEERDTMIDGRIDAVQESLLRLTEDTKKRLDGFEVKIKEFDDHVTTANNEVTKLSRLMDRTVKKTELKELESVIDLFNPLRSSFVTRDELEKILAEKLKK